MLRPGDYISETRPRDKQGLCSELAILLLFGFTDDNSKVVSQLGRKFIKATKHPEDPKILTKNLIDRCKSLGMKIPAGLSTRTVEQEVLGHGLKISSPAGTTA